MQRAHVVQAVGELDEDDADVVDHREQHLAEVLRLPLLARREGDRAELRDTLDDVRDVAAEQLADASDRRLRVLDDVVEQTGRNRHDIQLHVGQLVGDLERVHEVGLAGVADLSLVLEGREHVGPPQQVDIGVRIDVPDLFREILEPDHELWCLNVTRGAGPAVPVDGVFFRSLY